MVDGNTGKSIWGKAVLAEVKQIVFKQQVPLGDLCFKAEIPRPVGALVILGIRGRDLAICKVGKYRKMPGQIILQTCSERAVGLFCSIGTVLHIPDIIGKSSK